MEQIANAQLIANAPTMLFVLETVEQYFRCKNFVTETGIDNMLVLMRETIAIHWWFKMSEPTPRPWRILKRDETGVAG